MRQVVMGWVYDSLSIPCDYPLHLMLDRAPHESMGGAMTDNLEQLERDWPLRRPKDPSPHLFTWLNLTLAVLFAAFANLEAIIYSFGWHSRHPADQLWFLPATTMLCALQIPWLGALGSYRRIRKLVSGTSVNLEMQQLLRDQGARLLCGMYLAVMLILNSVEHMLH